MVIAANGQAAIELGIDVLEPDDYAPLKGKRIGLVTNQTGVDSRGIRTPRAVKEEHQPCRTLPLPEHRLDGTKTAGRYVRSRRDERHRFSRAFGYGATRKPTAAMLNGIDILVFDLQDIGCRSYTYISTMRKCMETGGQNNIAFVVLIASNPVGGLASKGRWLTAVAIVCEPIPGAVRGRDEVR
jgi:uncharacterized protein YbbC (DUF1343 family)